MKKEELIKQIFNQDALSYSYIETGLSNDNYQVELPNRTVVLRIPRMENAGLFDYEHEAKVLDFIKPLDLDSTLIYYNKHTGVKCNAFVKNAETFKIEYIERAALLIKRLHLANIHSDKDFNVKEKFHMYKERIKNPIYDTTFAHHIIDDLVLENVRLCHNDLVEGNLLFTSNKDYLIDYEYAADNDPFFDIMSFITENDIMDTSLRNKFYLAYFDRLPTKEELDKLKKFEIVHHVLWCEWGMMMYELHGLAIYKKIADLKYKRLIEVTR